MTIENKKEAGRLTLSITGRVDTTTAPKLEAEIRDSLAGVTELVLNLEKMEYISSAGLRVLLSAQKTMNRQGTMKLTHVQETIREIFEITGFDEILTIED